MTGWTAEKVDELRRLWAQGHSATEIGKRVKMSRNSVIGKAWRLQLTPRKPTAGGGRRPKVLAWNDVDRRDPDHTIDARDLAMLTAADAGGDLSDVAPGLESRLRELQRVTSRQEPVGEGE